MRADEAAVPTVALPTLSVSFDPWSDVLTVEGIRYAGELFRALAVLPVGTTVRIVDRQGGVLTLETVR